MENKKYYWLKLQNDFFSSLRIKKLRRLAGGDTFTIIYLKMQLISLKNNGVIEYKGIEKTFEEEMALELDEDVDNVTITIQYLLSCGLLEANDDEYKLPYVIENTGSETSSTLRSRKCRERQKTLQCNTDATLCNTIATNCNTEIEIEKEIEKEIEIEIEIDKEKRVRHKYGMYNNVLLSDIDYEKLTTEFPFDYQERIDNLSEYMKSTGKSYKDHLATIRNWARRDTSKKSKTIDWDNV